MKVVLVLVLVLSLLVTAYAYGATGVVQGVTEAASSIELTEPAILLGFGSLLLLAAGALRRLSV